MNNHNIFIFEKSSQSNHIFNSCLCSYLILYDFQYKKSVKFNLDKNVYNNNNKSDEADCCTKYVIYDKLGKYLMTIDVIYEVLNDNTIRIICRSNQDYLLDDIMILYNFFCKRKFRQII